MATVLVVGEGGGLEAALVSRCPAGADSGTMRAAANTAQRD